MSRMDDMINGNNMRQRLGVGDLLKGNGYSMPTRGAPWTSFDRNSGASPGPMGGGDDASSSGGSMTYPDNRPIPRPMRNLPIMKDGGRAAGAKASKRLDKANRYADGGRVSGQPKTKIDINITAGKADQAQAQPQDTPPQNDARAALAALAMAAQRKQQAQAAAPPPGGPPPGGDAGGMGGPGMGGPPMLPGMKNGGTVKMTAGAGSGEGRLQKEKLQRRAG